MTISRQIVKNTFYNFFSMLVGRALSFVIIMTIVRRLSVEQYGLFSFSQSFPQLFLIISELGMEYLVIREVAARKVEPRHYLGGLITLKFGLSALMAAVTLAALILTGRSHEVIAVTMVLTAYMVSRSFMNIFLAFFRGFERMEFVAVAFILEPLIQIFLVAFLLPRGGTAMRLAVFYTVSQCAAMLVSCVILVRLIGWFRPRWDPALWRGVLSVSWAFAMVTVSALIVGNAGIVILTMMKGNYYSGLYTSCMTMMSIMSYLQNALSMAVYPVIARFFVKDPAALGLTYGKMFKMMSLSGLPFCVGGAILAGPLLGTLFGPKYIHAAPAFTILCASMVFGVYSSYYGVFASSIDRQRFFGTTYLVAAAANVIFCAVLIHFIGFIGAPIGMLITSAILIISLHVGVIRPYQHNVPATFYWRQLLSLAVMAAALYPARGLSLFASLPIGCLAYAAGLLIARPLNREDMDFIRKAISRDKV